MRQDRFSEQIYLTKRLTRMRQILIILLLPLCSFSQTKVKEKREVYYTILRDKDGIEKKKKKNYVNNISKYDILGNRIEYIRFGEISHSYSNGSVACSWNYKNIESVTKYTFSESKLVADTTYYYKDNKVDYLASSTKYLYDSTKNILIREEEYNEKSELEKIVNYYYNDNLQVNRKTEIKYEYYSTVPKADTTITDFSYDNKNRVIKEENKTSNFRWSREYYYDDKLRIKRKFYFDNTSKFPYSIDYVNLDENGNPVIIESFGLSFSTLVYSTTKIKYDKTGLIQNKEEIPNYSRCEVNEPRDFTVYEYDFY